MTLTPPKKMDDLNLRPPPSSRRVNNRGPHDMASPNPDTLITPRPGELTIMEAARWLDWCYAYASDYFKGKAQRVMRRTPGSRRGWLYYVRDVDVAEVIKNKNKYRRK